MAFVYDLVEAIAFAVVAADDAVMSKLLPFLSHIDPNYSFDLMTVADMSRTMNDVTLTKEYLNKVDATDSSAMTLYHASQSHPIDYCACQTATTAD